MPHLVSLDCSYSDLEASTLLTMLEQCPVLEWFAAVGNDMVEAREMEKMMNIAPESLRDVAISPRFPRMDLEKWERVVIKAMKRTMPLNFGHEVMNMFHQRGEYLRIAAVEELEQEGV